MSIGIRKKGAPVGHGSDDVVSRLAECHGRIRAFLAEARALATGEGMPEARRASAAAVERYFREALPLHAQDEDLTIAPLLPGGARSLASRLAADHEIFDADLVPLAADWTRWAAGDAGIASPDHQQRIARLSEHLEAHLALEETDLFPLLAALPSAVARQIIAQMRARRAS